MFRKLICILLYAFILSACTSSGSGFKTGNEWVKAYYRYIAENWTVPNILLVDLDFDGVPEIFSVNYTDGASGVEHGVSYKNGKTMPLIIPKVTKFAGTVTENGRLVWHTYYTPYSPHRRPSARLSIKRYDYSELPEVTETDSMTIDFQYEGTDTDNTPDIKVFVTRSGKPVAIDDVEKSYYIGWYNGSDNLGENTYSLPHLAYWEYENHIKPQNTEEINLLDYCDANGDINYDKFEYAVLQN